MKVEIDDESLRVAIVEDLQWHLKTWVNGDPLFFTKKDTKAFLRVLDYYMPHTEFKDFKKEFKKWL